jgi:hypothetical protein
LRPNLRLLSKFYLFSFKSRLNESKNRDCDYIISVNFVTFLILWKIGKFEEAKRYIDINRKLIEVLLDEDSGNGRKKSESQLSVIMETIPQNERLPVGTSRTIQESFETGESLQQSTAQQLKSAAIHKA